MNISYINMCKLKNISVGHCVVCPCSSYEFLLPLWYLHTLLMINADLNITEG